MLKSVWTQSSVPVTQTCTNHWPADSPLKSLTGLTSKLKLPSPPTTTTLFMAAVEKTVPPGDLKLMSSARPGCKPSPETVYVSFWLPAGGEIETLAALAEPTSG